MVYGNDGRGLGDAVAFEHGEGEAPPGCLARFVAHALGAADGDAQALHRFVVGRAHVLLEEGVGRKEDRRLRLRDALRDRLHLERRWVEGDRRAGEEREHRPGGEAVAVEDRQRVEDDVRRFERDEGVDLRHVRDDVAVREDDALRQALRARREEDEARRVRRDVRGDEARRLEARKRAQLVEDRELFADVFQIDDLDMLGELFDQLLELADLDELPRRDDRADLGRLEGAFHGSGAGGEVQHRRRAAGRHQGEHGDDGAGARRQEDADVLAALRAPGERAAEGEGRLYEVVVGELAPVGVEDDALVAAMRLPRVEDGFQDRLARALRDAPRRQRRRRVSHAFPPPLIELLLF